MGTLGLGGKTLRSWLGRRIGFSEKMNFSCQPDYIVVGLINEIDNLGTFWVCWQSPKRKTLVGKTYKEIGGKRRSLPLNNLISPLNFVHLFSRVDFVNKPNYNPKLVKYKMFPLSRTNYRIAKNPTHPQKKSPKQEVWRSLDIIVYF